MSRGKQLKPNTLVQLVECPECGGLKTPVQSSGHDEDGHHIRVRKCQTCQNRFGTVEVPLPPEFSFHRTNTKSDINRTIAARYSKDRILIGSARILRGKQTDYCKKALHRMVGSNLRLRVDGQRQCRACMNEARRLNKMRKGDEIRKKDRDRYHKNRDARNRKQREWYRLRKERFQRDSQRVTGL